MKLTNEHGIPQTFVNILERPEYDKGKAHLSATQLLNSPKVVALTKKFDSDLTYTRCLSMEKMRTM